MRGARRFRAWHVTCGHILQTEQMATRMNMLKLVQEMRGLAQITNRRPLPRHPVPAVLDVRPPNRRGAAFKRKRLIQIHVQDPPDIPHPVKITYLDNPSSGPR